MHCAFRFIKRLWKAVHDHVVGGAGAGKAVDSGAGKALEAGTRAGAGVPAGAGAAGAGAGVGATADADNALGGGGTAERGATVSAAAPLDPTGLNDAERDLRRHAHQTLAKVTDDIGRRRTFNTAIAAVMELLNALGRSTAAASSPLDRRVIQEALDIAVLSLSPIIPHVTHALWRELGHATALIDEAWPAVDAAALAQSTIELVVQVNGKLRARITVAADADDATLRAAALADPNVGKFVGAATVRKVIVVPGKLVNIVV